MKETSNQLKFYTVEQLAKIIGCSERVMHETFNDPPFPCYNWGKTKVAEHDAVKKYFSVPRRK